MSSESAVIIEDWPQPGTGHRGPVLRYGRGATLLACDTDDDRIAVVTIPLCLQIICDHPNDEVPSGHPLYEKAWISMQCTGSGTLRAWTGHTPYFRVVDKWADAESLLTITDAG